MKDFIKKELRPVLELLGAIIVTAILTPCGLAWNLSKPFYENKGRSFKYRLKRFGIYWLKLLLQIWRTVQYWFHHTALWLDYWWNAFAGEFIEDLVTHKEDTWFGDGTVTVSAALGYLEINGLLNSRGEWLSRRLDKAFKEPGHCYNAYMLEIHGKELK